MLEGWYCRSMANERAAGGAATSRQGETNSEEDSREHEGTPCAYSAQSTDYKAQYEYLKQKLKFLIYENESFQDTLRSNQRRLLKISRDRTFLLDRLLKYEKPSTSGTDETESSVDEPRNEPKKRKAETTATPGPGRGRKKKAPAVKTKPANCSTQNQFHNHNSFASLDGHMTAEEVERHLQSRQSITELVPERAPPTVPTEMFSNEPSLDSESNDRIMETSPSNLGED